MPAQTNPDSWQDVLEFITRFPDDQTWSTWKLVATEFMQRGIDAGLDARFRAGQSMHHLLFSTLEHHGLRGEPHVTIFIRSARLACQSVAGQRSATLCHSRRRLRPFDAFYSISGQPPFQSLFRQTSGHQRHRSQHQFSHRHDIRGAATRPTKGEQSAAGQPLGLLCRPCFPQF
jgi:hypothetical protein